MRPPRPFSPRGIVHQTSFEIRTSLAQNNIGSTTSRGQRTKGTHARTTKQARCRRLETTSVVPPAWNRAPKQTLEYELSAQNKNGSTTSRGKNDRRELMTFSREPQKKRTTKQARCKRLETTSVVPPSRNRAPNNI